MDLALALPMPLRGLVIGFTIAAAVGPISLLTLILAIAEPLVVAASEL